MTYQRLNDSNATLTGNNASAHTSVIADRSIKRADQRLRMKFEHRIKLDRLKPFPPTLSPALQKATPRRKFPDGRATTMASDPGETQAFHNPETRRLKLSPIPPSQLPSHPLLENKSSTVALTAFILEILSEALSFTDTLMHSQFQSKGKPQTSSPSTAPVQLLTLDLLHNANKENKTETWFGRRSHHANEAVHGSASYAEMENGLFHEHAENEGRYTPDVFDTRHILSYTSADGLDTTALEAKGWDSIDASVFEMGHTIPGPLQNRVFSVLIVRGKISAARPPAEATRDANGFVTAQIPVDLSNCAGAFYANGRNRTKGEDGTKKSKAVMGMYVSVERVRRQGDGQIAWEMATSSDAGGWLPMPMQKMGVPGAVIKDVGLFMKWCAQERGDKV